MTRALRWTGSSAAERLVNSSSAFDACAVLLATRSFRPGSLSRFRVSEGSVLDLFHLEPGAAVDLAGIACRNSVRELELQSLPVEVGWR